jgi:hypothetical protein
VIDNQNEPSGFFKNWRQGGLAHRSGVATVFLGLALILSLLGAQIIVWERTPDAEKMRQASARGAELIQQVAKNGLEHYLGSRPIVRFYVVEFQGKPAGYQGIFFQPKTENDSLRYQGREIFVNPKEDVQTETEFSVANDLSRYEYAIRHFVKNRPIFGKRLLFEEGSYYALSQRGRAQKLNFDSEQIGQNMLPPMLLDFFTSLACRQESDQPSAFRYLDIQNLEERGVFADILELLVTPYNEFPGSVISQTPDGRGAKIAWYDTTGQQSGRKQYIYYDENHQIVQQENVDESVIIKSVDTKQLQSIFPDAVGSLNRWLMTYLYENTEVL